MKDCGPRLNVCRSSLESEQLMKQKDRTERRHRLPKMCLTQIKEAVERVIGSESCRSAVSHQKGSLITSRPSKEYSGTLGGRRWLEKMLSQFLNRTSPCRQRQRYETLQTLKETVHQHSFSHN